MIPAEKKEAPDKSQVREKDNGEIYESGTNSPF
jgi:hypothetical protein